MPTPSALPGKSNTDMGFDEWVKFIFDHPVADDIRSAWYFDDALDEFWDEWGERGNPEKQLNYAIRLFQNPAFLLDAYSPEQINEGFWFLLSGHFGFSLAYIIWNTEVSWPLRRECILSMVNVFRIIFTEIPTQGSCYMWWDLIRGGEASDERVKETMLQALSSILQIPLVGCQISALHGLGHLKHSGKKTIIENYLVISSNVDVKMGPYIDLITADNDFTVREYALDAIESNVL